MKESADFSTGFGRLLYYDGIVYLITYWSRTITCVASLFVLSASLIIGYPFINTLYMQAESLQQHTNKLQYDIHKLPLTFPNKLPYVDLNKLSTRSHDHDLLWDHINKLADKRSIVFKGLKFSDPIKNFGLTKQLVRVHLASKYNNLGLFLQDIANLPPSAFVLWRDLNIRQQKKNSKLDIHLFFDIYTLS